MSTTIQDPRVIGGVYISDKGRQYRVVYRWLESLLSVIWWGDTMASMEDMPWSARHAVLSQPDTIEADTALQEEAPVSPPGSASGPSRATSAETEAQREDTRTATVTVRPWLTLATMPTEEAQEEAPTTARTKTGNVTHGFTDVTRTDKGDWRGVSYCGRAMTLGESGGEVDCQRCVDARSSVPAPVASGVGTEAPSTAAEIAQTQSPVEMPDTATTGTGKVVHRLRALETIEPYIHIATTACGKRKPLGEPGGDVSCKGCLKAA
ncbi:hypothetical protein ABZ470_23780 [Streptosporangium sp. NPDC020072]|uniref:hypothetical protein n=1 Tax=Streptosporangium sp. NPDC020072 TaxID=3154788 RepID=UPI003444775A